MGAPQNLSSLTCEIRVIRVRNIEFVSVGNLFVRYYLLTSNGKRIHFSDQELKSKHGLCGNEAISLECLGAKDVLDKLRHQRVVVELRWNKPLPLLGNFCGSKLLFSAEIGWKKVLDSSDLSVREWVTSAVTSKYVPEGLKPPGVQIEMKIHETRSMNLPKLCHVRCGDCKDCGCRHSVCSDLDNDTLHLQQH